MAKAQLLYCVTDNEVFDALLSGRQQFSERALLNLAKERGIFYSPEDDRVSLISKIATLTFGFHEIAALQTEFERAGRGEKTTSFRLNTALTLDEIKAVTEKYSSLAQEEGDSASIYPIGDTGFTVDVKYSDLDLSRTRLRQRQTREAHIEFKNVGGQTIVTLPATDKAKRVAEYLSENVRNAKKEAVDVEEVDLSIFTDPAYRTDFFLRLISSIPTFKVENVTKVRVDSKGSSQVAEVDEEDENDATPREAQEMLGVVKAVALQGQSLLSSLVFQSLRRRGYFITDIQWSAKRTENPYEIVDFEVAFSDPEAGTGFKYGVRGWYTYKDGRYTQNYASMPSITREKLLQELESSAMIVYKALSGDFLKKHAIPAGLSLSGGE